MPSQILILAAVRPQGGRKVFWVIILVTIRFFGWIQIYLGIVSVCRSFFLTMHSVITDIVCHIINVIVSFDLCIMQEKYLLSFYFCLILQEVSWNFGHFILVLWPLTKISSLSKSRLYHLQLRLPGPLSRPEPSSVIYSNIQIISTHYSRFTIYAKSTVQKPIHLWPKKQGDPTNNLQMDQVFTDFY